MPSSCQTSQILFSCSAFEQKIPEIVPLKQRYCYRSVYDSVERSFKGHTYSSEICQVWGNLMSCMNPAKDMSGLS
jgi:hypothetical protein